MAKRDIIVIGASAGGFEAISALMRNLSPELSAAVFIVLHTTPHSPSMLAALLGRNSRIGVESVVHQQFFERNRVYTAIPDRHLMIDSNRMYAPAGPKENRVRPAIDPLFRSAAVSHTSCVIGVILTGMLDDGTSGLMAIKKCGGLAVVQDPNDAPYPDMPRSALEHVKADHCVPLAEMPALLHKLVSPCTAKKVEAPADLVEEVNFSLGELKEVTQRDRKGLLVPLGVRIAAGRCGKMRTRVFRGFAAIRGTITLQKRCLPRLTKRRRIRCGCRFKC